MLLAITFAIQKRHEAEIYKAGFPALTIFDDRAQLLGGEGGAPDLDGRPAVLRDGVRDERLADDVRVLARRRGPGPQPVAPARRRTARPTWSVLFVVVFALIITIPAYFPNHLGTPVAFLAVTSISVIGLYIAYTIPVFLRWRQGDSFAAGPVDARAASTNGSTRSRSSGSRSA